MKNLCTVEREDASVSSGRCWKGVISEVVFGANPKDFELFGYIYCCVPNSNIVLQPQNNLLSKIMPPDCKLNFGPRVLGICL